MVYRTHKVPGGYEVQALDGAHWHRVAGPLTQLELATQQLWLQAKLDSHYQVEPTVAFGPLETHIYYNGEEVSIRE